MYAQSRPGKAKLWLVAWFINLLNVFSISQNIMPIKINSPLQFIVFEGFWYTMYGNCFVGKSFCDFHHFINKRKVVG